MFRADVNHASLATARQAARDFAAALAETPQFQAFEGAYEQLRQDAVAQQALEEYRSKGDALGVMLMLNAVSEAERAELERLKNHYLTLDSVQAYAAAELELTGLCQQTAGLISAAIGIDYAASCGASCCG